MNQIGEDVHLTPNHFYFVLVSIKGAIPSKCIIAQYLVNVRFLYILTFSFFSVDKAFLAEIGIILIMKFIKSGTSFVKTLEHP